MTAWTPVGQQTETWTDGASPSSTWSPAGYLTETWAGQTDPVRVFDPNVFDRRPIFDTGVSAGLWNAVAEQQEVWATA